MSFKKDLLQIIKPYYIINILMSLSYILAKKTSPICEYVFKECEFDSRETEILFFLLIVVMIRTRKSGSITMVNYLSASFIYTKLANCVLWYYHDIVSGLIYTVLFVLCSVLMAEPTYSGPEKLIYFRGLDNMEEELNRDKCVKWLICYYAAWHPACVNFAPIFSQLSALYGGLDNLKFGKIDIGRYPDAAAKYGIVDGPTSKQLPTLILYNSGKENSRRPHPDSRNKLQKFVFSMDNVVTAFDLKTLYEECRATVVDKKTNKKLQ